jgi:hypothetical protein
MTAEEMDDLIKKLQWRAFLACAAGRIPCAETIVPPPPDELSVMIECMRTSAQDTLDALHRRGWKITRTCED